METNVVTQTVQNVVDVVFEHRNKCIIALTVMVVGVAAFFGYKMYHRRVQVAAHQTFVAAMKVYETPVKKDEKTQAGFASEEDKWNKVEEVFRAGYQQHTSSSLAPMFLAFQATALANLNKLQEAIVTMKAAIKAMHTSALKSYYEVTLSLMQLDSSDKAEQEEALNRLRSIAYDAKHLAQGLALFHLGLFSWSQKSFNDVKNYWQQFMVKFGELAGFEYQTSIVKGRLELLIA